MINRRCPPGFIFEVGFKQHLSAYFSTSATFPAPREDDQRHPSSESQKSIHSKRFGASLEIIERTHVDESFSVVAFCQKALKLCTKVRCLGEGKQLHSHVIKLGFPNEQSLQNQLLSMYVKCQEFDDAHRVFEEMPLRNVVSWNIMISGMVSRGGNLRARMNMGLFLFMKMLVDNAEPNHITFIGLLGACADINEIEAGKQLHCFVIKLKLSLNHIVGSSLVDLYGKCGFVDDARKLFDRLPLVDLVLWNVIISCYSLNGLGEDAFRVFKQMQSKGAIGDDFTFSSLLSSSGTLGSCQLGKQIHSLITKLSFDSDVLVASALVDMYVKNKCLHDARKAFDGMVIRNVVSWTTIIVGYGRHGDVKEAMKLLKQMLRGGFKPDELTLASILKSCAEMASITEITQVHTHATKNGLESLLSMGNGLINAYSKCGNIAWACKSFSSIMNPNIVTWTSIISAYAFHGLPKQAIETFEMMLSKGVRPDHIAFIGVLSACSHGGLVDEGSHYFASMTRDHQLVPDSEHYACIIDLLGRAGHLDKAYHILVNMPFDPAPNVLGAFMWACKAHGNIGLAKLAAERLFKLEPNEPVNYTVMSNIYASAERWIDVAKVRKMMRDRCDNKVPGCSWMENGGQVHVFLSSDKSHQQATEIYTMLGWLIRLIREEGYYLSYSDPQDNINEIDFLACVS